MFSPTNHLNEGPTSLLRSLYRDESGQDLIEYALIAALVALAAIATLKTLGQKLSSSFTSVSTSLTNSV